jgi:hypothetical protein
MNIRKWLVRVARAVLILLFAGGTWVWVSLRRSLPALDGEQSLPGLSAAVSVEKDAIGVPKITGNTRIDVARALGFVHAQDRFFQMDLAHRNGWRFRPAGNPRGTSTCPEARAGTRCRRTTVPAIPHGRKANRRRSSPDRRSIACS